MMALFIPLDKPHPWALKVGNVYTFTQDIMDILEECAKKEFRYGGTVEERETSSEW